MQNSSNRRAGPWLVLLCLAATAGTLYWVWKRVEPGIRYSELCRLIRSNRGKPDRLWSQEHRRSLWNTLGWFEDHAPERLAGKILESMASSDADERETAALLATNLELEEEISNITYWTSPVFPRPTESFRVMQGFGIHRLLQDNVDVVSGLARDERSMTRTCFLDLISRCPALYREGVVALATGDPEPGLRSKAARLLVAGMAPPGRTSVLRRLAEDPNPEVQLIARCLMTYDGDPESFKKSIALLTDPRRDLRTFDRLDALEGHTSEFAALADRFDQTKTAIITSDETLRRIGEEWKAWFQTKEFEEFAAELSKRR